MNAYRAHIDQDRGIAVLVTPDGREIAAFASHRLGLAQRMAALLNTKAGTN